MEVNTKKEPTNHHRTLTNESLSSDAHARQTTVKKKEKKINNNNNNNSNNTERLRGRSKEGLVVFAAASVAVAALASF